MANINDIESLFSLIGQSSIDYKEFYHDKNGLHALDKWSYLKNIQLENPNEEGISIFETPTTSPVSVNVPVNNVAIQADSIDEEMLEEKPTPLSPPDVVVSPPKVERYSAPTQSSRAKFSPAVDSRQPQPSSFSEPNVEFTPPAPTPVVEEPLTPQIYNPANTQIQQPAPQAAKVFSTATVPSVPTFPTSFNNLMNPSAPTTFTSSFIKPTVPSNSNLQSTFNTPPVQQAPKVTSPTESETKPNTQASPLNSIFSRLEQK
jgi:hypothetical protein